MGGIDMFCEPLCFCPMSETVALAWGLFQFSYMITDARVSTDVKTIGPSSVYVSGHKKRFKQILITDTQTKTAALR